MQLFFSFKALSQKVKKKFTYELEHVAWVSWLSTDGQKSADAMFQDRKAFILIEELLKKLPKS